MRRSASAYFRLILSSSEWLEAFLEPVSGYHCAYSNKTYHQAQKIAQPSQSSFQILIFIKKLAKNGKLAVWPKGHSHSQSMISWDFLLLLMLVPSTMCSNEKVPVVDEMIGCFSKKIVTSFFRSEFCCFFRLLLLFLVLSFLSFFVVVLAESSQFYLAYLLRGILA